MYHFISHSSVGEHLGYFHVLAIVNSASVNTEAHVSLWIMVFSGYMPRNKLLYHMVTIFIFLRNSQAWVLHAQLCLTLCGPIDCSPSGFSLHGIFQARILEWVAISFSRGSSWPRDQTHTSCIGRRILYHQAPWKVHADLHSGCANFTFPPAG